MNDELYEMNMNAEWNEPHCLVCPYCGEELWYELGYMSQHSMELWDGFWYKVLPASFPDHHDDMEIYCSIHYPE